MPLRHTGHESAKDFVDDAEGRGAVGGAAQVRKHAVDEAAKATTGQAGLEQGAEAKRQVREATGN